LQDTQRFDVDSRRVVHETIDGETILIQLETGTYYTLAGAGPDIWALLAEGSSEDEVAAEMQRRHPGDPHAVAMAISKLVADLVREKLLAPAAARNGRVPVAPPARTEPGPFEAPELKKYTDMEYFLLLDPIHEVDQAGWPNERAEQAPEDATAV
jgi:hypothetical protein